MLQLVLHRSSAALNAHFDAIVIAIVIDGHLRLDARRDIERFRAGLHQLEAQGCLPAGESDQVLQRLEESITTRFRAPTSPFAGATE